MKKWSSILVALVISVSTLYGAYKEFGFGTKAEATSVTGRFSLSGDFGYKASIFNNGTNDVWALMNCTTTEFNLVMVSTNGVPIPAGSSYTFKGPDNDQSFKVGSICYRTLGAALTSEIYIAIQ